MCEKTFKGPFTPSVSVNAAMTLAILFSLKTMELLQNGVATDFLETLLFLMRAVLLASSQSCCSVITGPNGPQDSLVVAGDGREGWGLLNEWLTVW